MIKKILILLFSSFLLSSLLYAQKSSPEKETKPTLRLHAYQVDMYVKKEGKLTGYYEEHIYQKEGKRHWELFSQRVFLDEKGEMTGNEITRVTFSDSFRLVYFHKTIHGKNEQWFEGTVKGRRLYLRNHEAKKKKTVEYNRAMLPRELLLTFFLTRREREGTYKTLDLISNEVSEWKAKLVSTKTTYMNLQNPEDDNAKKHKIDTFVIHLQPANNPSKGNTIAYEVGIKGPHLTPGTLLKFTEDSQVYSYRKTRSLLSYKSVLPSKDEQLAKLRQMIPDLLSGTQEQRIRAMSDIKHLGMWQGVPALIEMLRDENEEIRKEAHLTLRSMTRKCYPEDVKRWRRWWLQHNRQREREERRQQQLEEANN